jgi:O-antigen ligase
MRQRIFLLGIPFLMFQYVAVFFNNVRLFWVPGRLEPVDLMMIWLVIVWAIFFDFPLPARLRAGQSPRVFGPALSSPEEFVLIGIAALAALELPLTVLRFGAIGPALGEAKGFIYLFVGYFLLRGMFSRANRRDTIDLITALVVVNTIAAGFFVLHQGLHLPIYAGATEYQIFVFEGQLITRSFYFMPQLMTLALAFCFAKPKWGLFWMAAFLLNMAALWVSYTRTLIVIAAVELLVILGLRMLTANQAGRTIRRALVIGVVVVVAGAVAFAVLPGESRYFMSRIAETDQSGTVTGDRNLQNRARKMQRIYNSISTESVLLGQGYAAPRQEATADDIYWMSADVVWVPVLYRLGVTGVVGFIAAYGLFGWRALRLSLAGRGEAEFLALVISAALVGQLLSGLTSWTILDPQRYPMGLWLFAILAAEACRRPADAGTAAPFAEE